ncbi:hypothetical protein [Pseudoalteromonas rubra]|uniref:hypothetical protein n=1 Tax=Pseudoalteromonas rubra TaxID=43658 RepID=UPI002DBC357F|nr:hypothetical protein [Pseudoalteromonas rubra]MEC4091753.1 hypothetical protein [Pseudoalteromonas rubra]
MKYLIYIMFLFFCSGCASPYIPKTEKELRENPYQIMEVCSQLPLKKAFNIIFVNTIRCHAGQEEDGILMPAGGVFLPITTSSETNVYHEISDDLADAKVSIEFKSSTNGGFLQLIEIRKTGACPASISIYKLNEYKKWKTASEAVFKWLEGDTETCFESF